MFSDGRRSTSDPFECDEDDRAGDLFGGTTLDQVDFAREPEEGDGEGTGFFERESSDPVEVLLVERFRRFPDVERGFRLS